MNSNSRMSNKDGNAPSTSSSSSSSEVYILYKNIRILIYCLFVVLITSINISSGLFPYSSQTMKNDLNIQDLFFGMFSLSTSIGKIIGSIVFMTAINTMNRKLLIFVIILSKSLFIFSFIASTDNIYLCLCFRLCLGLCNMIINSFAPVWIEQFGIHKYRLVLQSFIQIGNPLGKILGYVLCYQFNWKIVFVIEGIALLISALLILLMPGLYFSSNVIILVNTQTGEEIADKRDNKNVTLFKLRNSVSLSREHSIRSETRNSQISIDGNLDTMIKVCYVLRNKLFLFTLMIRTCLISIQSTFQFWTPDYLHVKFNLNEDSINKLIANVLIIITVPLGAFFSGLFISFSISGYEQKNWSTILITSFYIVECFFAYYIPYIDTFITFVFNVIAYSFLINACLPMLQGVCMTSVHPKLKGIAFTTSHLFSFLVGTGLSPCVYGYLNQLSNEVNYAFKVILQTMMGVGLVCLGVFIYLMYAKNKRERSKKKKNVLPFNNEVDMRKSISSNADIVVQEFAHAFGEPNPQIGNMQRESNNGEDYEQEEGFIEMQQDNEYEENEYD